MFLASLVFGRGCHNSLSDLDWENLLWPLVWVLMWGGNLITRGKSALSSKGTGHFFAFALQPSPLNCNQWSLAGPFCGTPQSLPKQVFSFPWYRAYAEDSVRHGPRAEPGEKMKQEEEEEESSSEGRRAVASGDEEAPPEGKKKKRSGFRDRKVPNLDILQEGKLALYLTVFSEGPHSFGSLLSQHVVMSFFRLKFVCLESTVH